MENYQQILLLEDDSFMLGDPLGYNEEVVAFFREKYSSYIETVFSSIHKDAETGLEPGLKQILPSIPWTILERHLFPIFAAASCSGGISKHHINFAKAFIISVSLPVLRTDQIIDTTLIEQKNNQEILMNGVYNLTNLCLTYNGFNQLLQLPNSNEIIKLIILNYSEVYSSMYREISYRYNYKILQESVEKLKKYLKFQFSFLVCKYFSTTIHSSILLNSPQIHRDVKEIIDSFGRLRQLCDQISDIQEDITMGNLTIPILLALIKNRDKINPMIVNLWTITQDLENENKISKLTQNASNIQELVRDTGAFDRAYFIADRWYKQAINRIAKVGNVPGIGTEVTLLFRLKRAYLERLKQNNWKDIPNFY